MKKLIAGLLATTLALGAMPATAQSPAERAEERLAELTEGRTAGEPDNCIAVLNPLNLRVEENVGLVYERGDTIWIAKAEDPRQIGRNDVPIFQRWNSQLCTNDIIRTVDRYSGFFTGVLRLEEFVPYTRTARG
jgi:hypothetical protein